jgi:hypothetical protein
MMWSVSRRTTQAPETCAAARAPVMHITRHHVTIARYRRFLNAAARTRSQHAGSEVHNSSSLSDQ